MGADLPQGNPTAASGEATHSVLFGANGSPTKELHAMLGLMLLQQTFDLTDKEAVEQFAFNLGWHHALGIRPYRK